VRAQGWKSSETIRPHELHRISSIAQSRMKLWPWRASSSRYSPKRNGAAGLRRQKSKVSSPARFHQTCEPVRYTGRTPLVK
jgi:hypothetical protein